jgi:hypothetical protein
MSPLLAAVFSMENVLVLVLWLLVAFIVFWGLTTISARLAAPFGTVLYIVAVVIAVLMTINALMAFSGHGFLSL